MDPYSAACQVRVLMADEMQMKHEIEDLKARLNYSESRALRGQRSEKEGGLVSTSASPAAIIAEALKVAPASRVGEVTMLRDSQPAGLREASPVVASSRTTAGEQKPAAVKPAAALCESQ